MSTPFNLLAPRQLILLTLLTLFWGVNWSVMKFGIQSLPPLWFRLWCIVGGLVVLGTYARFAHISLRVPRGAWWPLFALAVPNMMIWYLIVIYAISMLSSGRAAILGYTTPVWAALLGMLFYGERHDLRTWIGVICAFLGVLLLVSGEFTTFAGKPLGTLLMLIAAATWAQGTQMMRRTRLNMDTLAITFWMMIFSTIAILMVSFLLERDNWRLPQDREWWSIGFSSVFTFGFCNVVWFMLARNLPAVASGLSGMMTPVVGVFAGAWLLGEVPHWQDYAALVLILVALASVVLRPASTTLGEEGV